MNPTEHVGGVQQRERERDGSYLQVPRPPLHRISLPPASPPLHRNSHPAAVQRYVLCACVRV